MNLKEQAEKLYTLVFPEDSEDFANSFTERYFDNCCRYEISDGKLVSMLYLLDCSIFDGEKTFPAKYLYAAATHPDYRNKGIVSRLIKSALNEGIIVTKPATKELFSFYEKFGFAVCSYKDEIKQNLQNEISKEEYIAKRKKLLKNIPHIILSDEEFVLEGFTLYGGDGYCTAKDSESGEIKEYICKDAPQGKTPFAMWTLKNTKPVFFGLAMD